MIESQGAAAELIGSLGVFLLLAAFVANVNGRLASSSALYYAVNALGAALACAASAMIGFRPFVVLEAAWTLAALVALVRARS